MMRMTSVEFTEEFTERNNEILANSAQREDTAKWLQYTNRRESSSFIRVNKQGS